MEPESFDGAPFVPLLGPFPRGPNLDPRPVGNGFGPRITGHYRIRTQPVDRFVEGKQEYYGLRTVPDFEWLAREMERSGRATSQVPADVEAAPKDAKVLLENESPTEASR